LTILIACCRQKKYKCDSDSKGENDSQNLYQPGDKLYEKCIKNMDAYLEEELYDILTYCIQSAHAADFEEKKQRVFTIGKELYSDGGIDAMENMFYSIEFRIKDEIGMDAKPYRSWWNNISSEWKY
jgi:hypothetical protein